MTALLKELGKRTLIMGILNVTPDSFYDGGRYNQVEVAVRHALEMVEAGADLIDVGGESARPGSDPIPADEEFRRVLPVIRAIREQSDVPISIDSYKAEVAEAALAAGADWVNDIGALRLDERMVEVVAERQIPVVLMHMQSVPKTMQQHPTYDDVVDDIIRFFKERIAFAIAAGIFETHIIIDPGIGFGKTVTHNIEILHRLDEFRSLGRPILIGTSRKSFLEAISDLPITERLAGTIASNAIAIMNGADIIRVHDVKEMKRAVEIVDAVKYGCQRPVP
ncbi:MAG: dihydropteroate synthase [Candidatus Bipolaricaulia bacterium]